MSAPYNFQIYQLYEDFIKSNYTIPFLFYLESNNADMMPKFRIIIIKIKVNAIFNIFTPPILKVVFILEKVALSCLQVFFPCFCSNLLTNEPGWCFLCEEVMGQIYYFFNLETFYSIKLVLPVRQQETKNRQFFKRNCLINSTIPLLE